MKLRNVHRALLIVLLILLAACNTAAAESTLETIHALGVGSMPCLGNPKIVVFRVIFAESETPPEGNVIEWTNKYTGDVREAEHIFFDPTLKEVNDSPKTYDSYYDSLRSFYYRSSYGKLDITGDAYVYLTQHEASYYTEYEMLADELFAQCEEYIDWSQYDDNHDGYVDGVYICPTSLPAWKESDIKSFVTYGYANTVKNMKISRFAYIVPNVYIDYTSAIKTIAHETFHMLGIRDIYQGSGLNPYGLQAKSVMELGAVMGDLPGICKQFFGWMDTPQILTGAGEWEIDLQSISVDNDWAIIYPLGNPDSHFVFVVEYVTNEANNQEPIFVNADIHHGIRIWRVDLNGNNVPSDPNDSIAPFDYIEAIAPDETNVTHYFYQPGESFTPWSTPSSDYATAYEYTTTGLLVEPYNRLCYIAESAYSGVYIDVISMDGETAKLRIRIEPELDLTGSEATVEVIDPQRNGIFLDQNEYFTFATISCPYNMAVNGSLYIRHTATGEVIPVSHILADDKRMIRLMIAREDLPRIQLDQEYTIQLPGVVTAFTGDELSFGDFDGTFVLSDIAVSLSMDPVQRSYGSKWGEFRYFRKGESEICFFNFDKETQKSTLHIFNLKNHNELVVPLEACELLHERLLSNYIYVHGDENCFNFWQIDDQHFAISFLPILSTSQTVVCYNFDGELVSEMSVLDGLRCVGQSEERYMVRFYDVQRVTFVNGELSLEPLDFSLEALNISSEIYNVNKLAEDVYMIYHWAQTEDSADDGLDDSDTLYPVTSIIRDGQEIARLPEAGWYDYCLWVGNDIYLFRLTDEELSVDVFDERGELKQQVTLLENMPMTLVERLGSWTSLLFRAEYADGMMFISFNESSNLYERGCTTTYLLAYDMDFNLKYYFHSDNNALEYGTPIYIGDNSFFYGRENYVYQRLFFERCATDTDHIQTKKYGKPVTDTECGLTDGIVCGLCGKVIVAQQVLPHKGCTDIAGDADCNGKVDLADALLVLQYIAGWEVNLCDNNADTNGNGATDVEDVLQILIKTAKGDLKSVVRTFTQLVRSFGIDLFAIAEQPADQYIAEGQSATFSILVTDPAAKYQWYVSHNNGRTWIKVDQATSDACTIEAVTLGNDGDLYRCVTENGNGDQLVSEAATLNVIPAIVLPETGDQAELVLWVTLMITSLSGLLGMMLPFRKSGRTQ